MLDSVASRTAWRVAIRRAEHQILDDPRVFDDPLSVRIIGPEVAAAIQPGRPLRQQRLTTSFRAFMAVRSRYAEDELARAVSAGVRQCVVLGAGLDTFACRNPHAAVGLRVFEVDHPATQAWKRLRLAAAGIEIPPGATFVALDFEQQSLAEELSMAGFDLQAPVFFTWLGVTPYLTDGAFARTMTFVAARPAGSAIVLDYAIPVASLNPAQVKALEALSKRVANLGEPFRLFFEPIELIARLRQIGFSRVEDLGRDEMNARYFAGRADGLRVKSNLARLMSASV